MTAGWNGNDAYVRTTEVQLTRLSSWKVVAEYPLAVSWPKGATINNVIYMTGGGHDLGIDNLIN